jgi:hypothetical protein
VFYRSTRQKNSCCHSQKEKKIVWIFLLPISSSILCGKGVGRALARSPINILEEATPGS